MRRNCRGADVLGAVGVLLLGVFILVFSVGIRRINREDIGIALVLASTAYLVLRWKLPQRESSAFLRPTRQLYLITSIGFLISISFGILLLRGNLYYRPLTFFLAMIAASSFVILEIASCNTRKSIYVWSILPKIFVLGFIVNGGIYYEFSGIYGVDPWLHNAVVDFSFASGHIPANTEFGANPYYLFPVFHVFGAMAQHVLNVNTYDAIFMTSGFSVVILSLFVFLIARKLLGTKTGLLAALLITLSAPVIERGTAIIPMSLGIFLFTVILYVAISDKKGLLPKAVILILLSFTLVVTHSIAALATLTVLISMFLGHRLFLRYFQVGEKTNDQRTIITAGFIFLFCVMMLAAWMRPPIEGAYSLLDALVLRLEESIRIDVAFQLTTPAIQGSIPYLAWVFNNAGYLLFLGFGVFGFLTYLNRKRRRCDLFLLQSTFFLLPIVYGSMLFSLLGVLPWRWLTFALIPLSVFGARSILNLSSIPRRNVRKLLVLTLPTIVLLFVMMTNNIANDDSPIMDNGSLRIGYTTSEIAAIQTFSDFSGGCPITDLYYGNIFPFVVGNTAYEDMVSKNSSFFFHRDYHVNNPAFNENFGVQIHQGGRGNFGEDPVSVTEYLSQIDIAKKSLMYSNGNVLVYLLN